MTVLADHLLTPGRFHPPAAGGPVVVRQPLVEELILVSRAQAQFISAPAGYGKTELLRQIADHCTSNGHACIFYDTAYHDDAEFPVIVDLALVDGVKDLLLLIDNVHGLTATNARRLRSVLSRSPNGHRWILAGRGPGHLGVEALAMERRLRQHGADRLAFTINEIDGVRQSLASKVVLDSTTILELTDGWVAAVLSFLSEPCDPSVGIPPAFFRFLDEVTLSTFSSSEVDAVAAASVLDSFTPASISIVSEGARWVPGLVERVPAIRVAGKTTEWSINPLYRKFVRARLGSTDPNRITRLHVAAARWYRQNGDHYRAASHAIEAGDQSFTSAILDVGARHFIATGRIADALRWLDYLGDLNEGKTPHIRLYRVTALIISRQIEEASAEHDYLVSLADQYRDADEHPAWLEQVDAQNRYHACLQQYFDPAGTCDRIAAQNLVRDYRDRGFVVGGEARLLLGLIDFREGRIEAAEATLLGSLDALQRSASWLALVYAHATLALIDCWHRSNGHAIGRLEGLLDDLAAIGIGGSPVAELTKAYLARHYLLAGDAAKAMHFISDVSHAGALLMDRDGEARFMIVRASVATANKAHETARELLLMALATPNISAVSVRELNLAIGRCYLSMGDLHRAREHVAIQLFAPTVHDRPGELMRLALMEQLTDLQIQVATRQDDQHPAKARLLLKQARMLNLQPLLVEALATLAVASAGSDQDAEAQRAINEAIDFARRAGCAMIIGAFPLTGLSQLLNGVMASDDAEASLYLRSVLDLQSGGQVAIARPVKTGARATDLQLTSKEIEILLLLSLGHSNQRISDSLVISRATTKWHVRNILSKLDAASRSEAVAKARMLNLIN